MKVALKLYTINVLSNTKLGMGRDRYEIPKFNIEVSLISRGGFEIVQILLWTIGLLLSSNVHRRDWTIEDLNVFCGQ